jgi:hypothetical protein
LISWLFVGFVFDDDKEARMAELVVINFEEVREQAEIINFHPDLVIMCDS